MDLHSKEFSEQVVQDFKKFIAKAIMELSKSKKEKDFEPMLFVGMPKDTEGDMTIAASPIGQYMKGGKEKDVFSLQLQMLVKEVNPIFISIVSEVWMSVVKNDGKESAKEKAENIKMAPSEDPNRKEMLMATYESKYISKMFLFPIKRDGNNIITLDTDNIQEQEGATAGRFANFYGNK